MNGEKKKAVTRFLPVSGGLSLVMALLITGFLVYGGMLVNKEHVDKTSTPDVRFVLNRCNLGDSRIVKVLHSYESPVSFNGDHIKGYEIEISKVSLDELSHADNSGSKGRWLS